MLKKRIEKTGGDIMDKKKSLEIKLNSSKQKETDKKGFHVVITTYGKDIYSRCTRNDGSEIKDRKDYEEVVAILSKVLISCKEAING